jgi:hypothetical protein
MPHVSVATRTCRPYSTDMPYSTDTCRIAQTYAACVCSHTHSLHVSYCLHVRAPQVSSVHVCVCLCLCLCLCLCVYLKHSPHVSYRACMCVRPTSKQRACVCVCLSVAVAVFESVPKAQPACVLAACISCHMCATQVSSLHMRAPKKNSPGTNPLRHALIPRSACSLFTVRFRFSGAVFYRARHGWYLSFIFIFPSVFFFSARAMAGT